MQLAGKYNTELLNNAQFLTYPHEISPGEYIAEHAVTQNTIQRYQQGDHLVWGGPQVGMFWASDIQAELKPMPIEHAYKVVAQANKELFKTTN